MFGHSLAANDDHVLRRIEQGKFERAYVSIHGDPDSDENRVIQERGELLSERRNENEASKRAGNRRPLEVDFYAADTAEVWTRQID